MKVIGKNPPIQLDAYLKQTRHLTKEPEGQPGIAVAKAGTGRDTVQLSDKAREVQQAAVKLKELPEVRQEKVQEVKLEIEKGTYTVSGARVATAMLQDSFENEMILHKINTRA